MVDWVGRTEKKLAVSTSRSSMISMISMISEINDMIQDVGDATHTVVAWSMRTLCEASRARERGEKLVLAFHLLSIQLVTVCMYE